MRVRRLATAVLFSLCLAVPGVLATGFAGLGGAPARAISAPADEDPAAPSALPGADGRAPGQADRVAVVAGLATGLMLPWAIKRWRLRRRGAGEAGGEPGA